MSLHCLDGKMKDILLVELVQGFEKRSLLLIMEPSSNDKSAIDSIPLSWNSASYAVFHELIKSIENRCVKWFSRGHVLDSNAHHDGR